MSLRVSPRERDATSRFVGHFRRSALIIGVCRRTLEVITR